MSVLSHCADKKRLLRRECARRRCFCQVREIGTMFCVLFDNLIVALFVLWCNPRATTTPDNIRPGRDLLMTLYGTGSLTHPETRGQGTKTIKLCNADRSSKTKTMMSTYHRWLETLPLPECATATRLKRNKTACMATSKACHYHAVATGAYLYSLKIAVKSAGREH